MIRRTALLPILSLCLLSPLAAADAPAPASVGPKVLTEVEAITILSSLLEASPKPRDPVGHCIFMAGKKTYCAVLAKDPCAALGGEWEEGTVCPRVERTGDVAKCICGDKSVSKPCPGEAECTCYSPGNVPEIRCR